MKSFLIGFCLVVVPYIALAREIQTDDNADVELRKI